MFCCETHTVYLITNSLNCMTSMAAFTFKSTVVPSCGTSVVYGRIQQNDYLKESIRRSGNPCGAIGKDGVVVFAVSRR